MLPYAGQVFIVILAALLFIAIIPLVWGILRLRGVKSDGKGHDPKKPNQRFDSVKMTEQTQAAASEITQLNAPRTVVRDPEDQKTVLGVNDDIQILDMGTLDGGPLNLNGKNGKSSHKSSGTSASGKTVSTNQPPSLIRLPETPTGYYREPYEASPRMASEADGPHFD